MSILARHVLTVVGFLLAVVFIGKLLSERRSPASTLAWILAIVLVPYVGVPLYFVLGGRKIVARGSRREPRSMLESGASAKTRLEQLLCRLGVPPATAKNQTRFLETGEEAYEETVRVIEQAERRIHVETFLLRADPVGEEIVERLIHRAEAGVEVRLLLDGFFAARTNRRILRRLRQAGGKVAVFLPIIASGLERANLRNHRKILVADDRVAIVGGRNLAEEYMGSSPIPTRWTDLSATILGPAVADISRVFAQDWRFASREALDVPAGAPSEGAVDEGRIQVAPSGPDSDGDAVYDLVLSAIFSAEQRILIATPYFVPDETLTKALVLASKRGVDVHVVVPVRSNHLFADLAGASYLREIEANGVRVHRYGPCMMHAKAIVIDEQLAAFGSANLDVRSLFLDYELSLVFDSAREIRWLSDWFGRLFQLSSVGLPEPGRMRAGVERVSRLAAPLL